MKKYHGVLMGQVAIPNESEEVSATNLMLSNARKWNETAYVDMMLACQEEVAFGLVEQGVSDDLPSGDARKAWMNLYDKFEPKDDTYKVELKLQFNNCKLKSVSDDPEEWLSELELLRLD